MCGAPMSADAYIAALEFKSLESGETDVEYLVSLQAPDIHTLSGGEQGPAGRPGIPGPAGGVSETSPAFTYAAGRVSRIDYASGAYKLFTYVGGVLVQLDYVAGAVTTRKLFTYNPDGTLAAITQEML